MRALDSTLVAIALLSTLALPAAAAPVQAGKVRIYPDDPSLMYSEYVRLGVDHERARFDRGTVDAFTNHLAPGARFNFRTDAEAIKFRVRIQDPRTNLRWFRFEIDGVLQDDLIGGVLKPGVHSLDLHEQPTPDAHDYSVILPHNASVELLAIDLYGTDPVLLPPPQRPDLLYVSFGDSITHGLGVVEITATYPALIGDLLGSRTINMGFSGRRMTASDGFPVGDLGGDLVTMMMGLVDYTSNVSVTAYRTNLIGFLQNLRAVQPSTPVFMITPTWTTLEQDPNNLGFLMDDYRQAMRDVVLSNAASDPQLHLIEGLDLVPNLPEFYYDGVHPTDAGFELYAQRFLERNLVRDGGFEQGLLVWNGTGAVTTCSNAFAGDLALQLGPALGEARQRLYGLQPGGTYVLKGTAALDMPGEPVGFGLDCLDGTGALLVRQEVSVTSMSYFTHSLTLMIPAGTACVEVFARKERGVGLFFVDELVVKEL